MPTVLESHAVDVVTLVEVVFVDSADTPTTFKFADQPYGDASIALGDKAYHLAVMDVGEFSMSRVSGNRLRGPTTADLGEITLHLTPALQTALIGLNCERQTLVVAKGRPGEARSAFIETFRGVAQGHEIDGTEMTVRPFSITTLFDAPYQNRVFAGRGRTISIPADAAHVALVPSPVTALDVSTGFTVEIGFTLTSIEAHDNYLAFRDGSVRLWVDSGGIPRVRMYLVGTGTFVDLSAVDAVSADTRYCLALSWDGVNLKAYLNGVEKNTVAEADGPDAATTTLELGGKDGTDSMRGEIDMFRQWSVGRSAADLLKNMDRPLDPTDTTGLQLNLTLSEGLLRKTFDANASAMLGTLMTGAVWAEATTGDLELKDRRKPSAFGESKADPVLMDKVSQLYGVHFRSVKSIRPFMGARELAILNNVAGNVTFDEADQTITAEASQDFSAFVLYQLIKVTGTASNDRTVKVSAKPVQRNSKWVLTIAEPPVDEGPVSTTLQTVTSSFREVKVFGDVDFIAADREIVAKDGQSFENFRALATIDVTGTASNNVTYTLARSPFKPGGTGTNWKLHLVETPVQELAVNATITMPDTVGEYTLDLTNGRFNLLFEPTKPVSAIVQGDDVGGYVSDGPSIIERMLSIMGSAETMALDNESWEALSTAVPWVSGKWDDGSRETQLKEVFDFMADGLFLYWFVSPRSGRVDLVELPPAAALEELVTINSQLDLFVISKLEAQKGKRHVEVRYRQNPQQLSDSDLDFFVATDRSIAGTEAAQEAKREWVSLIHPQIDGTGIDTDVLLSPVFAQEGALALAAKLWDTLIKTSKAFFEIDGWTETQGKEPWRVKMTLTDDDIDELDGVKKAYLVSTREGPNGSISTVVII